MSIHLLVAPPAAGKTQVCLEQVGAVFQARPLAPVWVLVPDRQQAEAMRMRLANMGQVMRARVATFQDLHQEILERSARSLPVAANAMLHRLLQDVIRRLNDSGQLPYFGAISGLPGFRLEMRDRIAELKRALVKPETLAELAATREDPGLKELARIYEAYQSRLQALNWADVEGLSWLAERALASDPDLMADLALLVVDGFDSFNPAQMIILEKIAARAAETWITLPGTPMMERTAHRRFVPALEKLLSDLQVRVETIQGPPHLPPLLRHVEAALFEPRIQKVPAGGELAQIEARSTAEEGREALRWVKARILRDDIPLSACAIAVPDTDTYRNPLMAAAAEMGIPLRFSQGVQLAVMPASAALDDLLGLAINDFSQRPLLDSLRSPYFDFSPFGLEREDARLLEIASRYGQIVQGQAAWEETLNELAAQVPGEEEAPESDEEAASIPHLPSGEVASRLSSGLRALARRLEPPAEALSFKAWARWLDELLEDTGFFECLLRSGENAAAEAYEGLLFSLSRSEALTGPNPVEYAGFFKEWQGLQAAACLKPDGEGEEQATPSVRVMRLLEGRGVRVEALAVLGLAEGTFPAVERADPFLDEDIRRELGLEPQLGQEQAGLFYQVITRADRCLLLTRPYLAKDGESWEPSPYWNAVQEIVEGAVTRIRPEDARALSDAASAEELLFWNARRCSQAGPDETFGLPAGLEPRWKHIGETQAILAARLQKEASGAYDGSLAELAADLGRRYGRRARWSASRLEAYATCPHIFLVSSALDLEPIEPPKLGYQANQLGSLLHEVLAEVYRRSPDPSDAEAVLASLPEVARSIFVDAPQRFQFRPSLLWEVQKEELLLVLERTIRDISAFDPQGEWTPLAFEREFGIGNEPTLRILAGDSEIALHGIIDRVDINRRGELRVIDYKSGGSHLAPQDLIDGRRLQLPLYALAAGRALGLGEPVEGFYWKLFQGQASALKLSRFESASGSGPQAAFSLAEEHIQDIVASIRSGAFSPRPPEGGCPSYCAAATWCWHFTPERRW